MLPFDRKIVGVDLKRSSLVNVTFSDRSLEELESNPDFKSKFDGSVVRGFRKTMNFIRSANDERDLYSWPGGRLEALKGDRSHQYSFRINQQWRLIVEFQKGEPKNTVHVVEIVDYH